MIYRRMKNFMGTIQARSIKPQSGSFLEDINGMTDNLLF